MSEPTPRHGDCGADVAAYVLGALDPDELGTFRRHLQSCSVCQVEVDTLTQTVNALPLAAPQYSAPAEVRRRLMTEVREDAKARRRVRARTSQAPLRVPRYGAGAGYKPGLISAGAMLALVLVLVLVAVFASSSSRSTRPAGGQVYSASIGSGEVVVRGGHAELIVHHLTQLGSTQTYEVWLEHGSGAPQPTSELFNVARNGDGDVNVPGGVTGVTQMLVTREPAAGSAKPTHAPVFAAKLS